MDKIKKYDVYIYIVIAYIFSVGMRMIWVYQFDGYEPFYWNNQLMINTNDGYFFASGVQNLVHNSMPYNQRVPGIEYGLVLFTHIVLKILPFSLEDIILYMPSIISSLLVVPIILVCRLYNNHVVGFLSAIFASIAWSFYNRTMTGYYDTDLFALIFPVYIVYFLIKSIKQENIVSLFMASLITSAYFYAYDASKPVIFALALGYIAYLFIFYRKNEYFLSFLILYTIASIDMLWYIRILLIVAIFISLHKQIVKQQSILIVASIIALAMFFYFNNVFSLIYYKIFEYVEVGVDKVSSLKFYQVHQTIREAGKISFSLFAKRIMGSEVGFILGFGGYVLLVFRKKEFLLFLPLVAIGFFAYIGGLRFTVYAIPAMAIGAVYFFDFIAKRILAKAIVGHTVVFLMTFGLLYPNIKHIIDYRVPTVFAKQEVQALDALKNISSNKDYTIAWWDYGYPIWYYSNTNTLIDGGKHNHDNFIVSQILITSSQVQAVNLSRLSVEKYIQISSSVADVIFKNKNPDDFLDELSLDDYKPPKKTVDIYLYLPSRMLNIFPTIIKFSNLDLKTGMRKANRIFYATSNFKETKNMLYLDRGIVYNKQTGMLKTSNNKEIPIKQIANVAYKNDMKLNVQVNTINPSAEINMIYMPNYHQIIILDEAMYNSLFIQMFVFEHYDKNLFEPVILTPFVKIYKLKR